MKEGSAMIKGDRLKKRREFGYKRMRAAARDKGETKIGDASFHMTSGDVMKMDGRPRRSG